MTDTPIIGWSDFARGRCRPGQGRSFFRGSEEELVTLLGKHWDKRRPGAGREDLDKVVLVPCPPEQFACATVLVGRRTKLSARLENRQAGEAPHIRVTASGEPEPAKFVNVVLYSAAALEENDGTRSGDFDWEIVAIVASPVEDEPMNPLTMARNTLEKPGGTYCEYTAREFADAVYYWSRRAGLEPED